ncbi:PiggyBac transposable element-derived protein 4 [Anthophora retusa]
MSKRSRKDITFCDIISSDDDFYVESSDSDEVMENSSSDSGNEVQRVVRKQFRRFNISSDSEDEGERHRNQSDEANVDFTWRNVVNQDVEGVKIPFTTGIKPVSPQASYQCNEPIEFFKLFFADQLMNTILEETNKYARAKIARKNISVHSTWNTWVDVTKAEISAFLEVILNMGTIPLPNLKEYWSTARNAKIPYFAEIFRRDRFLQIFWMLHANKKAESAQNMRTRSEKISNYLHYLDMKFRENFVSSRELSIDEAVVRFKGKISFITYNPKKPTKWGIRIICTVTNKSVNTFH